VTFITYEKELFTAVYCCLLLFTAVYCCLLLPSQRTVYYSHHKELFTTPITKNCLLLPSQSHFPCKLIYMPFLSYFPVAEHYGTAGCVVHITQCIKLRTRNPCFRPRFVSEKVGVNLESVNQK